MPFSIFEKTLRLVYPDFSYLLHHWFGTDVDNYASIIKTFGLLLALAFYASASVLSREFKIKEKAGILKPKKKKVWIGHAASTWDYISTGFFSFIVGFKLLYIFNHFAEMQEDPSGLVFSTKGSWLGGLIFSALMLGLRFRESEANKLSKPYEKEVDVFPHQRVGDITVVAGIFGILGAKLFSILENFSDFLADPVGQLFSGAGLTIYGGLILAFVAVYIYVKRNGIPPIHVMDSVAPSLMIGYAVGRMGCQLSGDGDWGIVNTLDKPSWFILPDWMWSYSYPNNVLNEGVRMTDFAGKYNHMLDPGVFPTAFYEVVICFLLFLALLGLRNKFKIPGMLFFTYMIFTGVERFFIEFIRVNPKYNYFGFEWSQAQYISIAMVLVAIVCMFILRSRNNAKLAPS